MRWDRLFADLEAAADDEELLEREALVAELRDEEWARTSWRALVAGEVELEVAGAGTLAGRVTFVNDRLVRLSSGRHEHVVACASVRALTGGEGRAAEPSPVHARLGWPHVLRRLRDEGEPCRVVTTTSTTLAARVDQVLADAVLVQVGQRRVLVPLDALAVVSLTS